MCKKVNCQHFKQGQNTRKAEKSTSFSLDSMIVLYCVKRSILFNLLCALSLSKHAGFCIFVILCRDMPCCTTLFALPFLSKKLYFSLWPINWPSEPQSVHPHTPFFTQRQFVKHKLTIRITKCAPSHPFLHPKAICEPQIDHQNHKVLLPTPLLLPKPFFVHLSWEMDLLQNCSLKTFFTRVAIVVFNWIV